MLENIVKELILKYRFPLDRKYEDSYSYLRNYFMPFMQDISTNIVNMKLPNGEIFLSKDEYSILISLKYKLLYLLDLESQSRTKELINYFDEYMELLQPYLLITTLNNQSGYQKNFFRIRPGNYKFTMRKELFVIPSSLRHIVQSYRFSIPGNPCLYLSTSLPLAWYECGMPLSFSAAEYRIEENTNLSDLQFLDFAITPIQINNLNFEANLTLFKNYLFTFMLRAACSITVKTKNASYKEEYVISQLLMSWIRQSDFIKGVQYRTCSKIEHAKYWNSYNIAIPSMINHGEYTDYLWNMFNLSKPQFFSIVEIINSNIEKIDLITFESLLSDIQDIYFNNDVSEDWRKKANFLMNLGLYYQVQYESIYNYSFNLNEANFYALQNSSMLLKNEFFDFSDDKLLNNFYLLLFELAEAFNEINIVHKLKISVHEEFLKP